MTKAEEIAALETFIRRLPDDSYLKPWLVKVLPQVIADIRNDFVVSPSTKDTRLECEALLQRAKDTAATMILRAETDVAKMVDDARREANAIRHRVRSALHECERAIDR